MTKEDYKEKVEELRQEIELEDTEIKRSRSSRHGKPKTKKQRNPVMTLLVCVFILIPLSILFYVWFLFEPEVPNEVVKGEEDKGVVLEIQNQQPVEAEVKAPSEDDKESASATNDEAVKQVPSANDEAAKQAAAAEEARKAEEAEMKKAEEAQKAAAAKLEEQKRLAAEEAKRAQQAASAKSHTVLSTDNLYRIALKYYGNGSAEYVNKIKQANGLSSDSISAGQVLIIP